MAKSPQHSIRHSNYQGPLLNLCHKDNGTPKLQRSRRDGSYRVSCQSCSNSNPMNHPYKEGAMKMWNARNPQGAFYERKNHG